MPVSNKRKRSAKNHEKSLSYEEKNKLSEIDLLYNTNLFKLKAEEFFKEFSADDLRKEQINHALMDIKTKLFNIHELMESPLDEIVFSYKNGSIILPVASSLFNAKQLFRISPIERVEPTGSYMYDCFDTSRPFIDLIVEMPIDFTKDDFKSKNYFLKRALFLCHIARYLQSSHPEYILKFISPYGQYFPFLVIECSTPNISFVLFPCIKSSYLSSFKLPLYQPDRRNLKITQKDHFSKENEQLWNTPFYNQFILRDLKLKLSLSSIYELILKSKSYSQSLVLLKSWIHKRIYGSGIGCVTGFMVAVLFSYLINERKIHPFMQPFQIIRIFLCFISSDSLSKSAASFYKEDDLDSKLKIFNNNFPIVLLDSSGDLNLLFGLSKNNYNLFMYDALRCLEGLNSSSSSENIFENMFLTKVEFYDTFDHYFKFDLTDKSWLINKSEKLYIRNQVDIPLSEYDLYYTCIYRILKQGLKEQIHILYHKNIESDSWPVNQYPKCSDTPFSFGIILNIQSCNQLSIIGPLVNDVKSLEFRDLWGPASKPYKFSDGSVKETVTFNTNSKDSIFQPVCFQIVSHLLYIHCNIEKASLSYLSSQLDFVLKSKNTNLYKLGNHDQNYILLNDAYEELSRLLSENKSEKLKIKNVFSTSSHLLRTSIICPPPIDLTKIKSKISYDIINKGKFYRESVQIIVHLSVENNELSESIHERECHKMCLISRLAQYLKEFKIYTITFTDHLEVHFNGFLFNIQIYIPKELKIIYSMNVNKNESLKSWSPSLQDMAISFHFKPLHWNLVKKISYSYKCYGLTCRLFKRWVSSQLLSQYFSDQLCELVVAYIFINPLPTYEINCHLSGFRRTLKFISEYDWAHSPLVISLEMNDISEKIIVDIRNNMRRNRSEFPAMVILTPYDDSGVLWSSSLSLIILNRIVGLAKTSYDLISTKFIESKSILPKSFNTPFSPNLKDFDIIIFIDSCVLADSYINLTLPNDSTIDEMSDKSPISIDNMLLIPLYNPLQAFIKDLITFFNDIITFFYDSYNPHYICGVLKAHSLQPVPFNVTNCLHKEPIEVTPHFTIRGKCRVSLEGIAADIKNLGKGICKKIDVNMYKN